MEPEAESAPAQIGGFRVIRRLSSGATTDVLLARAEGPHGFERVVALKVLLQQYQSDPAFERMFAREASAYARLSHPAIVKLYDFFSTDGQLVMVLEYVDGLPLHKLRAMLSIGGERFEDSAALFIGSRIFAALGAAHSARDPENGEFSPVIHRDINPSNVLVPWDGHVKISDFGIAKIGAGQGDTRLGFVKGTYGYMAPEQVRGEGVTVRADVYAATLVLWELLARRKAIQRGALPEVEVLKAMAKPEIPSLDVLRPDVPAEVREAVRRGLEPSPDRRSITADEMAGILRLAMSGDEGRARLADAIARVRPPPSEGGLAVTKAHPAALAIPGEREKARADLEATLRADPDETTRVAVDAIPDDSGAFKRSEIAVPADVLAEPEEAPRSSTDLTMVEARRPHEASDPPPTEPPTSEPGTQKPDTLSLPHMPSDSDWREPADGFVRASPTPEQPHTLRFGNPGEVPEGPEGKGDAPPAPPRAGAAPPPLPAGEPSPPRTGPGGTGGGTAIAKITLTSVPRPSPSAPSLVAANPSPDTTAAEAVASPVEAVPEATAEAIVATDAAISPAPIAELPLAAPEPPLPRFPMPSGDAQPPPIPAPAQTTGPHAAIDAPRSISPSTVRVRRKPIGIGIVLGVVVGSALVGVGAVEAYLRFGAATEAVSAPSNAAPTQPPAPPPAPAPATAPTAAATAAPPSAPAPSVEAPRATETAVASAAPPPAASAPENPAATPSATTTASAPPPPKAAASSPAAASAPPAEPTARPAGSDPDMAAAKMGEILTRPAAGGHRIYVDERVVGNSPDPVQVHCGPHNVRIGSAGTSRDVDVPCGGSIVVNP